MSNSDEQFVIDANNNVANAITVSQANIANYTQRIADLTLLLDNAQSQLDAENANLVELQAKQASYADKISGYTLNY